MGSRDGGTTSPALLDRLANWRDDAAWQEFVERYRPVLENWCRQLRLDDQTADELCQRVWIDLARRIPNFQYDPSRKFRGWLRRLWHSRAVDLLRERQVDLPRTLDESQNAWRLSVRCDDVDDVNGSASRTPDLLNLGRQVHDAVKRQVEPQTWHAFWSIAVDGHTIRETADALQMSYAAAFAAHKRVVSRLRAEGSRVLLERMNSGFDIPRHDRPSSAS